MEYAKNLKNNFSNVGAFSSEHKFICQNPDEVIQWINSEVKAFEEILSDRGDFCTFDGGLHPFFRRLVVIMPRL
jgi:hypothetical protein